MPLIKDLDTLPFPARHLLPMQEYKKKASFVVKDSIRGKRIKQGNVTHMITSRGCPFRCSFCADHTIHHQTCRARSPENVVAEMKEVIAKYHVTYFVFIDPNFFQYPSQVIKTCKLIVKEGLEIGFGCEGRVDTITLEMLYWLKRAGCTRICFGIKSGSPRLLEIMNKKINIEQAKQALALAKRVGLSTHAFFIYGIPGELDEDYVLTRNFIRETRPDSFSFSMAIPFPGTDLYRQAIEQDLLELENWSTYNYYWFKLAFGANLIKRFLGKRDLQYLKVYKEGGEKSHHGPVLSKSRYTTLLRQIYFSPTFLISLLKSRNILKLFIQVFAEALVVALKE